MPNEIIDEEELKMLQQMKMLKKTYRAAFAELRGAKSSLSQVMQTIDVAKQQLVAGFEAWYDETFGAALA
jgi:tRNA U34 5-methylaminomethyl-2-thiouridine-forming methyltransferase MnmC